jgi:Lrp/AsnC family leucine-responsive transcriptional regulator
VSFYSREASNFLPVSNLDLIDKGILSDLLDNCRITYEDLSRKHGISANAVKKRVLKLEESGVIDHYSIRLSLAMLDAQYLFGLLRTDGSQDEEVFVNKIGESPSIVAAAAYSDGHYALVAEYISTVELMELGTHLRTLDGVEDVELHTLVSKRGTKTDLSTNHLKALFYLRDNPRISIVDLARESGMTARRVRRLVTELVEGDSVLFTANLELGEAGSIPFLARVAWNERVTDYEAVIEWLMSKYPDSLWEWYISVSEPVIFCLFTAEDLNEMNSKAREIRQQDFVDRVKVIVSSYHDGFGGPRSRRLDELIQGVLKK